MRTLLMLLGFAAATGATAAGGTGGSSADWISQVGAVRGGISARVSPASIVTNRVDPTYPHSMRAQGIPGYVRLELAVDETGRVLATTVIHANHRAFADAAIKAAEQWQFQPVSEFEEQSIRRVQVPIKFALVLNR